jgi:hypothetical protein
LRHPGRLNELWRGLASGTIVLTMTELPSGPLAPPARTSGMAIAGFVCSFFCGVLGLIFSVIGRGECRRSGGAIQGEGLAIAGMVISIVNLVFALLVLLSTLAIPAFMDAAKKTKQTEALIQLDKIGERAITEYHSTGSFPREAAPLTPSTNCCSQNAGGRRKCAADPGDWNTPAWRALDFDLSRDFYYQYSYEPLKDGTEFVARAVGDRDCDGVEVTYELRGKIVNGVPTIVLTEPPPNAD